MSIMKDKHLLLEGRSITINNQSGQIRVDLYGRSGNDELDAASVQMLHGFGVRLKNPELLKSHGWKKGSLINSDYEKTVLGEVKVVDYSGNLDTSSLGLVHIFGNGVEEHRHLHAEYYIIPEGSGEGELSIRQRKQDDLETYELAEGRFFHIPSRISHTLKARSDLYVIVYSLSSNLIGDFSTGNRLSPILSGEC